MKSLVSFIAGAVFALGLGISGMTRPVKVIGFLDFAGHWDPSLAFVMIGAIAVYFVAYRWIRTRPAPVLTAKFSVPQRTDIDRDLVIGAAIFGAGWGLGRFLPRACTHFARFRSATGDGFRYRDGSRNVSARNDGRAALVENFFADGASAGIAAGSR